MKTVAMLLTIFLFSLSSGSLGQGTAQIVGTITDPSAAVVPGVSVTVSNASRGYVSHLVTNSAGTYTAADLPIGDYVVSAEASGFTHVVRRGIQLHVAKTLRIDIRLQVGQPTQTVTINGNVPHVQTETGAISHLVTGTQVANMPLDGRNFTQLATLVPGVVADNGYTPGQVAVAADTALSFNGNRTQYNNYTIDGTNDLDEGSGSTALTTFPSVDSIAEFRVTTTNYGADLGKHAGAQIQLVTKSGTKEFHGDAYEYFRNDALDANDWFLNRTIAPPAGNAPKQPLTWNDYGFTLGGPVYIPKHYNTDKSKTFFFWSEEWRAYRQGVVINSAVPTLLERKGDFNQCDPKSLAFNAVAASGCAVPKNLLTGQPFPNDTVPLDPNAAALLNADFPYPNNGIDGYTVTPNQPQHWRGDQIRIDQNISDKTRAFVRFTYDSWGEVAIPSLWTGTSYDSVDTNFREPARSMTAQLVHTFKPTMLNAVILGFSEDQDFLNAVAGAGSPAHSIDKPAEWTAKTIFPENSSNPLLPAVGVCGGVPFCATVNPSNLPWTWNGPVPMVEDQFSWIKGNHQIKIGALYEVPHGIQNLGFDPEGYLTFNNSNPITTGNALADMYLGRIAQYEEGTFAPDAHPVGGDGYGHWRYYDFEPYIQDNWRATHKLTLNLGMRYYYLTPYANYSHPTLDSCFVPSQYNPALQAPLDAAGNIAPNPATGQIYDYTMYGNGLFLAGTHNLPLGCARYPLANFAPRFGFAFDPTGSGKTAIRGGYGLFYENGNGNEANVFAANADYSVPPVSQAPSAFNIAGYGNIVPGPVGPSSFAAIPPYNVPLIQIQDFSLSVQHAFSGNEMLSVAYVASLGHHLASASNLNQVPIGVSGGTTPALAGMSPYCTAAGACDVQQMLVNNVVPNTFFVPFQGYGYMMLLDNVANSNYNSLQADFRHTMGHGLTLEAAYTWSHELDDSTSGSFNGGGIETSDLERWYGTGGLNRAQILEANYVYDIPAFRNSASPVLRGVLGGWSLNGITSFFSGEPTGFLGCGIAGLSSGIGQSVTCNSLGPVKIQKGTYDDPQFGPTPTWFNPSVVGQLTLPQLYANGEPGMFGYMGRNVLTGPGRNNWDIGLFKELNLPWHGHEPSKLEFRLESFNTFNHPQWQSINASCSTLTLPGQPCSGSNNIGNGEVASDWGPRVIQMALKLIF